MTDYLPSRSTDTICRKEYRRRIRDDQDIYVEEQIPPQPVSPFPFIFMHGLLSSLKISDEAKVMHDFASHGIYTIRFDARGHGESCGGTAEATDYTWPNMAKDCLAIMDSVAPISEEKKSSSQSKFVCGGMSLGCATSIEVAMAAPDRVKGLVLVIPPTAYDTRRKMTDAYERGAKSLEELGIEKYIANMSQRPDIRIFQEGAVPYKAISARQLFNFQCLKEPNSWHVITAMLRGAVLSDLPPLDEIQSRIGHIPTLILAWTDDNQHPVSTAEMLLSVLTESKLNIARTLESVQEEWPRLVASFIQGLDASNL